MNENLGGQRRSADDRDVIGTVSPTGHPTFLFNEDAFMAPIFDQNKTPSCGAHAGAWLSMLMQKMYATPRFTWIQLKSLYATDKNINEGVDMRAIFASLKYAGTAPFEPLENNTMLSVADYSSPSALTPDVVSAAKQYVIGGYVFNFVNGITIDSLMQLVNDNKLVLLLISVGAQLWTAANGSVSYQEKDILPLRAPSPIVSEHFIVCHSFAQVTETELDALDCGLLSLGHIIKKYSPSLYLKMNLNVQVSSSQNAIMEASSSLSSGIVIFANSFGTQWGFRGHGYFKADYTPFIIETGSATMVDPRLKNQDIVDSVKQEISVLKDIKDPDVKKTFIQIIIAQCKELLGISP